MVEFVELVRCSQHLKKTKRYTGVNICIKIIKSPTWLLIKAEMQMKMSSSQALHRNIWHTKNICLKWWQFGKTHRCSCFNEFTEVSPGFIDLVPPLCDDVRVGMSFINVRLAHFVYIWNFLGTHIVCLTSEFPKSVLKHLIRWKQGKRWLKHTTSCSVSQFFFWQLSYYTKV